MKSKVLVIGHRNPDSDAVISAISFSYILERMGFETEPCVAGDISPETRIILEKARLGIPRLIEDIRVRVSDVMTTRVFFVYSGEPVKRAIDIIVSRSIRSVPIVDRDLRVKGLFSAESFARKFLDELSSLRLTLRRVPIKNFLEVSNSKLIVGSPEGYLDGRVYVAAMGIDSIRERARDLVNNIVVVGDRYKVIADLIDMGVSTIIVTGGREVPRDIVEKARSRGTILIVSPHDTYTTLRLLDLSQPVERFAEPATTIIESAFVNELRDLMVKRGARTIVVVDELGKLCGIVTRSDLVRDYRKRVAMVDHNEFSQSIQGIEEAVIVAVVDHHRVSGDVETHTPIIYRIEPVGATNTIIWRIARERGIEVPKNIAEAMLYAILSDTLLLRSPTTTDIDREVVNEIARYVGIDLEQAMEFMRIAIAANEPSNPIEIVTRDMKEYEYSGLRFAVSQIFTASPSRYISMANRIREAMDRIAREKNLDLIILMVTDYIENSSVILARGRIEIVEKALGIDLSKGYAEVKGLTSRKSQLLPKILEHLQKQEWS